MSAGTTGGIFANCGHEVDSYDHLIFVYWPDEDCDAIEGFYPCVTQSPQCPDCAGRIWMDPTWVTFATEEESHAWLHAESDKVRRRKGLLP